MLQARLTSRRGRDVLEVTASVAGSTIEEETSTSIEAAETELTRWGFNSATIIRSRLWAADRETRDRASQVRKDVLAGPKRGASSSFIAPTRLAAPARVAIDILALRPRPDRDSKTVQEYEPPIVPPAYVVLDGLVVLSGLTDLSTSFDEQLDAIRRRIDDNLSLARAQWTHVISVGVYLHRSVAGLQGREAVLSRLPQASGFALSFTQVEGFSAQSKLIEIEVTADLGES